MPEKVGLGSPFSSLGFKVREDLQEAYHRYRKWLSGPGEWWSGEERVAMVRETRVAWDCLLCVRKKEALSPKSIAENHSADPPLSRQAVEAIHRIVTDPSRLSEQWVLELKQEGFGYPQITELIGVVTTGIAMDYLFWGLGLEPPALPESRSGNPTRGESQDSDFHTAWVPTVIPEKAKGGLEAFYEAAANPAGGVAHIMQALSAAPETLLAFYDLASVLYLPPQKVANPGSEIDRAITRPQIELLAATVSAANACRY
jgi:alkylhydroperoxidase family enzyme